METGHIQRNGNNRGKGKVREVLVQGRLQRQGRIKKMYSISVDQASFWVLGGIRGQGGVGREKV